MPSCQNMPCGKDSAAAAKARRLASGANARSRNTPRPSRIGSGSVTTSRVSGLPGGDTTDQGAAASPHKAVTSCNCGSISNVTCRNGWS